jgi:hypothetical protein
MTQIRNTPLTPAEIERGREIWREFQKRKECL